ncbi:MAG TPA: ATP-binding cassette domain-containing protein [Kofleriaceae bacterium]|nr:ATP-binding cassette domain-containing protein [Kofleriaceae bacterium]
MVTLDNVTAAYGPRTAVGGVSFRARRGETTVLLGRSGSGKTTILRLINRMVAPRSGRIAVAGRDVSAWNPIELRRQTGYIIQHGGLFPHYTVARNVAIVPTLLRWPAAEIRSRVDDILETVGLPPSRYAHRYPRELSGGERQRVGIARALAADPPLLICDEPFAALDPVTRRELQNELCSWADTLAKTVLFVTHDIREALYLGHHVVLLHAGKVAVSCKAKNLASSDHPEARAFIETLTDAGRAQKGAS